MRASTTVPVGANSAPSTSRTVCNRMNVRLQAEIFTHSGDNTLGITLTTIEADMTS
jgi:hypothetical protein